MPNLLTVSLIGSVMILLLIGLRRLLQNYVHRTVFLLLWLLIALRLAVPVSLPSAVSIYNFMPQVDISWSVPVEDASLQEHSSGESCNTDIPLTEMAYEEADTAITIPQLGDEPQITPELSNNDPHGEVVDFTTAPETGAPITTPEIVTSATASEAVDSITIPVEVLPDSAKTGESLDFGVILTLLWAVGCGGCFLYFLWVHIRGRLAYRFAVPEEGPEFLGNIRLKRSDAVSSPIVYGFFRPVILLPVEFPKKDSPEYEQILWHEVTHVRSGDLWYKLFMLLVTCVHWFNPLVWLMLRISTQDLEIRCDARVIDKLGAKKAYALTLIKAEVQQESHFAEAAFAFSLTELRLKAIAKTKAYAPRSILLLTVLAVVLVCCFATGPVAVAAPEPGAEQTIAQEETIGETTEEATGESAEEPTSGSPEESVEEPATEETASTEPSATESLPQETEGTPDPTRSIGKAYTMNYLLSCGYEPYDSVMELSLKEGESKTLALRLPEDTALTVEAGAAHRVEFLGEYSPEEGSYFLTVKGLDEGRATLSVSVGGYAWMEIRTEIRLDPYFSVPDWERFEAYGSSHSLTLSPGLSNGKSISLLLPERATYTYSLTDRDGESVPYSNLSVSRYYLSESGKLNLQLSTELRGGEAVFYFYIDGIFWCKLNVDIKYNSTYSIPMDPTPTVNNSPGGISGGSTSSSGMTLIPSKQKDYYNGYNSAPVTAYEYLSGQSKSGVQPAIPQYTNYGGAGSNGPIHVYSPVVTSNGKVIMPGTYWP